MRIRTKVAKQCLGTLTAAPNKPRRMESAEMLRQDMKKEKEKGG